VPDAAHRRAGLEIIGSERGLDGVDIAPEDAVIVYVRHFGQRGLDGFDHARTLFGALCLLQGYNFEPDPEQFEQFGGNIRMPVEAWAMYSCE
jgi:hypothetical protein